MLIAPHLQAAPYVRKAVWSETVVASREVLAANGGSAEEILDAMEKDFPVEWDWLLQDGGTKAADWFAKGQMGAMTKTMIGHVLEEVKPATELRARLDQLTAKNAPAEDPAWVELYVAGCEARRAARLASLPVEGRRFVFTRHYNLGGSHYAYTEGQSDAQSERHFVPGTALEMVEIKGTNVTTRTLVEDAKGVIRDPAVSFDGKRILFSWKKSDHQDDYHLYEMDVQSGTVRQLTEGLGFADYEGAYLPGGDIVFNSTRCVQTVDCWWTEVSNLYKCDKDGHCLRRLAFDQVHDNYPSVLEDGRVIYTRW